MLKVGFYRHFQGRWCVAVTRLFFLMVVLFLSTAATAQSIKSSPVEDGTYGATYTYNIEANSWLFQLDFRLITGTPWLTLTDNGDGTAVLSGVPTEVGTFPISIEVSDNFLGGSSTQDYNLVVGKATPVISWTTPSAINYGTALSATQLNASSSVPGTFTYSPASGAVLNAGTRTLSVDFVPADDTNYNSVNGTTVTLTVNKINPTVTWSNPGAITYGTALSGTQLNATASVAGSFNYTPAAGVVLGAGTRTLSVDFTPTDAVNYNSVTGKTVTIEVDKATPIVSWSNPAAIVYGTALGVTQLNATANTAGAFTYTPASGAVLAAGTRTLSVDFSPSDTDNFNPVTGKTVTIEVQKATPTITWATPTAITYGTALSATQLNASANTPGSFAYNPLIGAVLGAGTRTLNVEFTPTDAANFTTATGSVSLVVNKATPTITWATPAAITYGTALSATQLNATSSTPGTFTYTPASGTVLPAGTRTLSVDFAPTDAANFNPVTGRTVTIEVQKATPVVSWSNPAAITYGTALSATQLNATASTPGTFTYTPASGAVLNAGTRTLSVDFTPTDAANFNPVAGTTVSLIVNKATPVVTWTAPAAITYGTALSATQLNASANTAGTFTYDPGLGTVLGAGTRTLSVDFAPTDANNYNPATGSVSLVVNKATPVVTWATPTAITYGTALSATQLNATANTAGTFVYNPVSGTVLNAGPRTLSVEFTPTDAANYTTATGSVSLTVNKATPTITWATPAAITYGTALSSTQLNATASTPGTFTYTPASGAVLNAGTRTLSVDFTPTDAANFNLVTNRTVTIEVQKATPVVTWTTPAAITYGTALSATQLNATASTPGAFTYTPASGVVLNAGTRTLSVDFVPTDAANYNSVAGTTVVLTVNKATPVITWASPAPITYGTAINATQLNATANVPGTFTYAPPTGTVLNAGTRTLSADFVPTDGTNYNSVLNTQRSITVNKATPTYTWNNPAAITYPTPLSATQLNATFSVAGTASYIPGLGTILPAGDNQVILVNFTPTDANYNSLTALQVLITVQKGSPVLTWSNPADIVYGTALGSTQLNATSSIAGTFAYSPASGTVLPAGAAQTLSTTFTPTDANNYNGGTKSVSINVSKANPVITWPNIAAISYGTALSATQLNATTTVPGTFTYNPPIGTVLNSGAGQTITATFTPTDVANYNTIITNKNITVNKVTPTVTWPAPAQIVYGTPLSSTQQNATANVDGTFLYTPLPGAILTTGANQTISVKFTPNDLDNYNVVNTTSTTITVIKATPVVTWTTPLPIKVNVALSSTQLNADASVPGTKVYSPAAGTSFATEGNYTLHVAFTPTDQVNYNNVPDTQVQLTVNSKDNPTITWADPATITYGTALSATQLNATASVAGTYAYSKPVGTVLNAGVNQTLTVTFTPTDQVNYNVVNKSVQIDVNKAPLTATAVNASRAYGFANPNFTINYSGFVNNDAVDVINTLPTASTTAGLTTAVSASPVAITLSGGLDDNYTISLVNANLTITRAPLTARAANQTRIYGAANPPNTITYTGFRNGETVSSITAPTATTAASPTTIVGTADINVTGGSAANYTITNVKGTLTITQATLTVTPDNQSRPYGSANPANFTITYSGFVNGENSSVIDTKPTAGTTANVTSPVIPNGYPITASGGSDNNYLLVYQNGKLTITRVPLTATAENKSTTYGTLAAYTIVYSGFVNGEDISAIDTDKLPVAATTTTVKTIPGTYPITLTGGDPQNYTITNVNGTLTINKAPLTLTADNKTRVTTFENPPLTISYSGFKNDDNESMLDVKPSISTSAVPSSPPGDYPITVSGGTDHRYAFTYVNGTLTVVLDVPPVVKNFQVETDEDVSFNFLHALFESNRTDDPNGKIFKIKIVSLPQNGVLFNGATRAVAGDEITVTDGQLSPALTYQPNSNYFGNDTFQWNMFDGSFYAVSDATITIKIKPVNDPPVLSNIETSSVKYSLGDAPIIVSEQIIINDVDDNFIFSASILIANNFTDGDQLSVQGGVTGTDIQMSFDQLSGELKLTGKASRTLYESTLKKVTFASPVSGEATISEKLVTFTVRDSTANSNIASRKIAITEVFPELDIVNAFTPNGDNVNDVWDVLNLEGYSEIDIFVFDQNGSKVFECHQVDCAWDGTNKGVALQAGPYMYTINVNNGKRQYKGTVNILK